MYNYILSTFTHNYQNNNFIYIKFSCVYTLTIYSLFYKHFCWHLSIFFVLTKYGTSMFQSDKLLSMLPSSKVLVSLDIDDSIPLLDDEDAKNEDDKLLGGSDFVASGFDGHGPCRG